MIKTRFECRRCRTEWGFADLTFEEATRERRHICPRCKLVGRALLDTARAEGQLDDVLRAAAAGSSRIRTYWYRFWFGVAMAETTGIIVYILGNYYGWF